MNVITNWFQLAQATGNINWNTDTFKWHLCSGNYVETSAVVTSSFAQVSAFELPTLYGYTSAGVTTSGNALISSANQLIYGMSNPTWLASGGPIGPFRYAVLKDSTRSNCVVYFYDFKKNYTANDGATVTLNISSADGLFHGIQKVSCSS